MNPSDLKFSYSLGSDNHAGIHPRVMEVLQSCNRGHAHAYGLDEVSELAKDEFARAFGPRVQPEYVFTGTAANVVGLATQMKSFEAVLASDTSHLNQDECGAFENFVGAKLWLLKSTDGRIFPEQALEYLNRMGDQHYSQPRWVSLTQPTELGVCYSVDELKSWSRFCRERNLMLHLDGARLSNAAASLKVSLREMTEGVGVDVVSFGGTKNGLMGAEAVLLFSDDAKKTFKFYRKQAMQLSSKTRFLAAQFWAYLHEDLWLEIARHTGALARELADSLKEFSEIEIVHPVQSNALFVRLPKSWVAPLKKKHFFYVWDSDLTICRWMISWDWTTKMNQEFVQHIREVKQCFPVK